MKTRTRPVKTAAVCAAVLLAAAAASFVSMNYFDRSIFESYPPFQYSFAVLALSLLLCAFCRKPAAVLPLCAAAAVAMWFRYPVYAALLFPVVLQAVLYDACRKERRSDLPAYCIALGLWPVTFRLWFLCKANDDFQLASYTENGSRAEKYLYLALLFLLAAFYGVLLVRQIRRGNAAGSAVPRTAGKNRPARPAAGKPAKKKDAAGTRRAVVYCLCAVNAVLAGVYSACFMRTKYCKLLFLVQALFLLFLEYRREPLLYLHGRVGALLDAAQADPAPEAGE